MDIADDKAMIHLAQSIAGRWGGLGLWVHAAIHAAPLAPAGSQDLKDLDKCLATNIRATASLIPLVEPLLRVRGGTALFLDDPRGGERFFGAYGATKAAQIALAQSWQALEGVESVTKISRGATQTTFDIALADERVWFAVLEKIERENGRLESYHRADDESLRRIVAHFSGGELTAENAEDAENKR